MKKYSVGFYTLGCKVSQYETEAICELFERSGYEIRPFDSVCDVYVINTCTVTAESDRKCRQIIRRAVKTNKNAHVLVCGCYSQREPEKIAEIKGVSAVIGTDRKLSLVDLASKILSASENGDNLDTIINVYPLEDAEFESMTVTKAPRTRAYVKIEDGCDSRCTYCAIKEARGHVRSKRPADVIAEVERLRDGGTHEIVLTGIEIGAYGKDFEEKYTLADLIAELDKRESCTQIRIGSLAPELITDEFIDKLKNTKILCPHFHISVQSGSDKILGLMKRRYTSSRVLDVIKKLRDNFKGAMFTTDIMVGFPYETEAEFTETLDFAKKARFLDAHVFCYSKREGTEACGFDSQVDGAVKEERSKRLSKLIREIRDEILDSVVLEARPTSAIVETLTNGLYTAHTPSYIEISIDDNGTCDLRGKNVKVRPVSHKNGILHCEIVN